MGTFDPESFMNTQVNDAMSTSVVPCPEGEYIGMIAEDVKVKQVVSNKTGESYPVLTVLIAIDDPSVTKGTPTAFSEQAFTLSNSIDIDSKMLRDVNTIQDPFAQQLGALLEAYKYEINTKFILNTHFADPKAPDGLRERLDNTQYGNESEMKIDCGTLDISQGGATAAKANQFLEFLDQLLSYMGADDGTGVVLYCNDTMLRRIPFLIRLLGAGAGFEMTTDAFGRRVQMYRNAKIVDVGRKQDQSTRIITNTEATTGLDSTSDQTSVYGVKYGLENAFRGWEFDSLENSVIGPFLLQNGVQQRITIDWTMGFFQEHTRAVGRLYNIKIK